MKSTPVHPDLPDLTERELSEWLRSQKRRAASRIGLGSQAAIYLYDDGRHRIIVKRAKGVFFHWLRLVFLRREYRIYQRLEGIDGIPRCFGLLQGRYLLLEYIDAPPLRDAAVKNREVFLGNLRALIMIMHEREVAHGDLKRKDNILVVAGVKPLLIDFGVATIRKPGFHPLNRFIYGTLKQMDLNAWLKHKYGPGYQGMSEQDRPFYRATAIERIFDVLDRPYHSIKRAWRRTKARFE